MQKVTLQPLTVGAFAPFGEVPSVPAEPGRAYFERSLSNGRAGAWPSLSIVHKAATDTLPVCASVMERHEFSSQTMVPLGQARWVAIVAPHQQSEAKPDMSRVAAFLVGPGQGITYGANVWHHPLTVLDESAEFVVFMWRDGTASDEEFVDIAPLLVTE